MRPIDGKVRTPPNEYRLVPGFALFALQTGHERWEEDQQDFDALQRQQAIDVDEHESVRAIPERGGGEVRTGRGPPKHAPCQLARVREGMTNLSCAQIATCACTQPF